MKRREKTYVRNDHTYTVSVARADTVEVTDSVTGLTEGIYVHINGQLRPFNIPAFNTRRDTVQEAVDAVCDGLTRQREKQLAARQQIAEFMRV